MKDVLLSLLGFIVIVGGTGYFLAWREPKGTLPRCERTYHSNAYEGSE